MPNTNVIALPTAAKQKVRQPAGRNAQRFLEAMDALPRFPVERVIEPSPYVKQCREEAALMLDSGEAAIMQLALAIMRVLDDKQRISILGGLAGLALRNRPGALGALAWANYEFANKNRKIDIDLAAHEIAKERGL